MARLTKQQAFDTVAKHLFTQGKMSVNAIGHTCMYRGRDGLKCAIGVLIPDTEYQPEFEQNGAINIADRVPTLMRLDRVFLSDLQNVHDMETSWVDDATMDAALREVARRHRVKPIVLDGLSFNRP